MDADDLLREAVQAAYFEVSGSRNNTEQDHEREIERLKDLVGSLYPDVGEMIFCDRCGCQLEADSYNDDGDYCADCQQEMSEEGA